MGLRVGYGGGSRERFVLFVVFGVGFVGSVFVFCLGVLGLWFVVLCWFVVSVCWGFVVCVGGFTWYVVSDGAGRG